MLSRLAARREAAPRVARDDGCRRTDAARFSGADTFTGGSDEAAEFGDCCRLVCCACDDVVVNSTDTHATPSVRGKFELFSIRSPELSSRELRPSLRASWNKQLSKAATIRRHLTT
ncbi:MULTISPECIES: hypothetical protein [Bradyrhizobium]|uniref:hypothetical protein n=1 Tax=Bradyrhizobium TaxID=374 RepID=UPI0019110BE2|nr:MULTISPECIES: hypothetical protein [Bradyrhizobium]